MSVARKGRYRPLFETQVTPRRLLSDSPDAMRRWKLTSRMGGSEVLDIKLSGAPNAGSAAVRPSPPKGVVMMSRKSSLVLSLVVGIIGPLAIGCAGSSGGSGSGGSAQGEEF